MQYLLLGPTEARDDSHAPLPIGGARLRALLASLALRAGAPLAVTVTDLVDEVWGDDPPRDAPAALQALVSRLRRALGARDRVLADPTGGYRLAAAPEDVDLHRFTRLARDGARQLDDPATPPAIAAATLRSALALWRGPALADLPEPARSALAAAPEALRTAARRGRVEAELRAGAADPASLLPELDALIHEHPYDEPLRVLQLRTLRAAGRPADALAAYERTRRTLADSLGTDPGPALRAFHAELLRPPPEPTAPPEPPEAPRGNLRPRLTSFVGREPDLEALHGDLSRHRLVTLIGPGGSGKTRLAEHAAADHPEPGWLVELARLDHPAAVPGAVLSALGLRENGLVAREKSPAEDPTTLLIDHCAHRGLLLVLDNCEHVIGAAAELADRLLAHCPGIRVLATSREPLGVPGEVLRPVEPLPPDPAHRLFADRAAAAQPGFTPDDDPAAVAEICARLDGLPLAIELAAARLRLLTPRQIADRLDDRFRLLTGGSRTLLPRQQTLRAVVDWSWDLLTEPERAVLRRLAVFTGGCDLTAAEAVCAAPALDVADVLGSLVDKSLVLAEPTPDGMRYRMLETIHEYAISRAADEPAQARTTALRHAAHFLALAEEAEPLLRSAAQLPWIRRVETELDNLRAALDLAVRDGDSDTAQRAVFALGWFWWLRNYRIEGAEWTARVLALTPTEPPEDSPAYLTHQHLQVLHMFLRSESSAAEEFRTPEYRALTRRLKETFRRGSPETSAFPGILWPTTALLTGDLLDFHADLDEAVENCRRYGGDWELGVILMLRTHVAIDMTGGLHTVDADLVELHEIADRVGDRWTRAQVSSAAGEVALSRGQYDWARIEYEECLRLAREVGAHIEAPFAIARIAETAYCSGDMEGAERLLAESDRESRKYGGVYDVRAFARLLASMIALYRGDHAKARAEYVVARAESKGAGVPPQFIAGLDNIEALLVAHDQGPRAALAGAGPAFADAISTRCAERVLAALAETAAGLLAATDRPGEALRILAAATAWRSGHPRSVPEEAFLDGFPERARALLGPARSAAEEAAGAELTPPEVAALLKSGC
ncbi:winged helix-turn-helix domain-containing protein [Streptomyces sp. NBC_00513]|uniref:BTAD domain-containing putative transcriptional regulator n=1 Tax=unclassified Streptomyces TaxID=2593676 RepID=UPI00225B652B|nr:BTAD domain-containing putative transcriptional regulator [Streptomyces sp. NBC_00424]MCX5074262.1 winged helix-turn-helix domain-containing protein [Streptomyces sp. NBC_00424]WUD42541.1 winged helix-turn-helix domain-containing protein [Streptomyces sp. NBC_00513]